MNAQFDIYELNRSIPCIIEKRAQKIGIFVNLFKQNNTTEKNNV